MTAGMGDSDTQRPVVTCGCASEMRRVCDLCASAGEMVVACSLTCLDRHLANKHDGARASSEIRARQYLGGVNLRLAGHWQAYQDHRGQVMALALAAEAVPDAAAASAGDIAIFGAGEGSDPEVPRLAGAFRAMHPAA